MDGGRLGTACAVPEDSVVAVSPCYAALLLSGERDPYQASYAEGEGGCRHTKEHLPAFQLCYVGP